MSENIHITDCPTCKSVAEVDMSIQLLTHPVRYNARCTNEHCGYVFTVFEMNVRKKTGWEVRGRSVNKTSEVHRTIGEQAMSMKPDEIMINKGNYTIKRRLPENIESILEKYDAFEEIINLYIHGKDEYETSDRHTLDMFKDDVFDILEKYLG